MSSHKMGAAKHVGTTWWQEWRAVVAAGLLAYVVIVTFNVWLLIVAVHETTP